jgi:hypothetical protein
MDHDNYCLFVTKLEMSYKDDFYDYNSEYRRYRDTRGNIINLVLPAKVKTNQRCKNCAIHE